MHPNDPDHGSHHEWEVWNRVDHSAYRDAVPRFCSEFGFQGPPTWATLQRAVRDGDGAVATKDHPTFLLHQKADDGNAKLDRGLGPHLGVPDDFTDWHWATQLNQARAVTSRAHALPVVVAQDGRRDRLAAQRLLAGDVVGRGRRRRAGQAAVVGAAGGVRRPPAHRAAPARADR